MENNAIKIQGDYEFGRIVIIPGKYIHTISYWGNDGEFSSVKVLIRDGEVVEASTGTHNPDGVEIFSTLGIPLSILNHQAEISDLIRKFNSQ